MRRRRCEYPRRQNTNSGADLAARQREIQFLRIMLTLYYRFGYYTRNTAFKS